MRSPILLAALLAALALGACSSGGGTIDITQFDATCTADADCGLVFTGDVCGCSCAEGAIRASEVPRFNQEVSDARQGCSDQVECMACEDANKAVCQQGKCAAVPK
jgi:hypothetical protein